MKTRTLPAAAHVALALVWLHAGCADGSPISPDFPVDIPPPLGLPSFRLAGDVYEAGSDRVPVADAVIEATSVSSTSAVTNWYGGYVLFVGPGNVNIRILKDGYRPLEQTITVVSHQSQNFEITLDRPRPTAAGTHRLTITAAEECRQGSGVPESVPPPLPEAVMTRTYVAAISQDGPRLDVTLSGATFHPPGEYSANRFDGRLEPNRAVFQLDEFVPFSDYAPDVIERIEPGIFLVIEGLARVDVPTTRRTGTLAGSLKLFASDPWSYAAPVTLGECSSDHHRFVLSR